jgi:anti-anti-sigma factor
MPAMTVPELSAEPKDLFSPNSEIHVREITQVDDTLNVILDGQIRYLSVSGLQGYFHEQLRQASPGRLVLDFCKVTFVDSQGLALLIGIYKFCLANKTKMAIRGASSNIRSLLELTRINKLIELI